MDNARLHCRQRPHVADNVGQSFEAVVDQEERVGDATVFHVGQDTHPELRAPHRQCRPRGLGRPSPRPKTHRRQSAGALRRDDERLAELGEPSSTDRARTEREPRAIDGGLRIGSPVNNPPGNPSELLRRLWRRSKVISHQKGRSQCPSSWTYTQRCKGSPQTHSRKPTTLTWPSRPKRELTSSTHGPTPRAGWSSAFPRPRTPKPCSGFTRERDTPPTTSTRSQFRPSC